MPNFDGYCVILTATGEEDDSEQSWAPYTDAADRRAQEIGGYVVLVNSDPAKILCDARRPVIRAASACWTGPGAGRYAVAQMLLRAHSSGFVYDAELDVDKAVALAACYIGGLGDPDEDEHDLMLEVAHVAEQWLNKTIAPSGYLFGWRDDGFMLWPKTEWDRVSGPDEY